MKKEIETFEDLEEALMEEENEDLDSSEEEETEEELDEEIEEEDSDEDPEEEPEEEESDDEDAEESEEDESDDEGADESEEGNSEDGSEEGNLSAKDQELEQLRRELNDYKRHSKKALARLGNKNADPLAGLAELAAEADGKSVDEYLESVKQEIAAEDAQKAAKRAAYEQMKAADLAAIHAAFPAAKSYTDVEQIPNFKRFGELRDGGASAEEAFRAVNPNFVADQAARAAKQAEKNNKGHLKSNVPKGSKDHSVTMTKSQMKEWKEMFPGKSTKEIMSLYKRSIS
jgi:hypothetical protein